MIHHFILVLSVFMLSTAPVLVKFLTLPPLITLIWRLTFVSLLLLPFAWKSLKTLSKDKLKMVAAVSFVLVIHFLTWFAGIAKLSVAVTAVTFASNPIFTAIIGFFVLNEPFKKRYLVAISMSIFGIYQAFYSQAADKVSVEGIVLILIASFLYSLYMVLSKRARKSMDNSIYAFSLNSIAGIMGFIACIFAIATGNLSVTSMYMMDGFSFFILFLLALLPSVLGHTLMIQSLPRYNLNLVSCLKLMSPLSASLLAVYFYNEDLNTKLIVGFIFVASGVMFAIPRKQA